MTRLPFSNRAEAGRLLGTELAGRGLHTGVVVLALPRGGVPVGFEVAKVLRAPLDVVVVRKLGVPWQPELAMGAVAGGSVQVLDEEVISDLGISREEVASTVAKETAEVERREKLYRGGRPAQELYGKVAILVDDGLATGSTMLVAAHYVLAFKPARVVIAVPVGSWEACDRVKRAADEIVCLATPETFKAVGNWFEDFRQLTDAEVQSLLEASQQNN